MLGIFSKISAALPLGTPHQIGIDIGAASVKIVGVRGLEHSIKVVAVGEEETPMGCVNDGVIADPKSMAEIVHAAIRNSGVKNCKGVSAAVGIRGVGSVFRRFILPMQSSEEMANQIMIEAQNQFESDLSDWIVDYQIISEPDRKGLVAVMLVGAKRHVVEDYLSVLKHVGVRPTIFDCDIFAIANTYDHTAKFSNSETVACLDVGRDSTKFNLLQNGSPIIVRSFQIGGMHLTEAIAKHLSIDFDQAENMKKSGENTPDSCDKAISNHIKEITNEIRQTVNFFTNSSPDIHINKIDRFILSGGGSSIKRLADNISATFGTDIEFADPFRNADVATRALENIISPAYFFAVAYGLALRRIGDRQQ